MFGDVVGLLTLVVATVAAVLGLLSYLDVHRRPDLELRVASAGPTGDAHGYWGSIFRVHLVNRGRGPAKDWHVVIDAPEDLRIQAEGQVKGQWATPYGPTRVLRSLTGADGSEQSISARATRIEWRATAADDRIRPGEERSLDCRTGAYHAEDETFSATYSISASHMRTRTGQIRVVFSSWPQGMAYFADGRPPTPAFRIVVPLVVVDPHP